MNYNALEIGDYYAFAPLGKGRGERAPRHAHKVKVIAKRQIRVYPNKKLSTRVAIEFDTGKIRTDIPGNQIISTWESYLGERAAADERIARYNI